MIVKRKYAARLVSGSGCSGGSGGGRRGRQWRCPTWPCRVSDNEGPRVRPRLRPPPLLFFPRSGHLRRVRFVNGIWISDPGFGHHASHGFHEGRTLAARSGVALHALWAHRRSSVMAYLACSDTMGPTHGGNRVGPAPSPQPPHHRPTPAARRRSIRQKWRPPLRSVPAVSGSSNHRRVVAHPSPLQRSDRPSRGGTAQESRRPPSAPCPLPHPPHPPVGSQGKAGPLRCAWRARVPWPLLALCRNPPDLWYCAMPDLCCVECGIANALLSSKPCRSQPFGLD